MNISLLFYFILNNTKYIVKSNPEHNQNIKPKLNQQKNLVLKIRLGRGKRKQILNPIQMS